MTAKLVTQVAGFDQGWNFGPDPTSVASVEEFVARFERAWGASAARAVDAASVPREAMYLSIDASHAKRELGWNCRLSLDEAIGWTVEWHKSFESIGDGIAIAHDQIKRYETFAAVDALGRSLSPPEKKLHAAKARAISEAR